MVSSLHKVRIEFPKFITSGSSGSGSGTPPLSVNWSPHYDVVTGAAPVGAWGLRKLVSTWSGAAVRIRDTADNSEQDVGFAANGPLADFTVAGNAAIVTLYDQSGNGNHLTQATTTLQPLLVRAPVSFSGWPAIRFDGSDDYLHDATTGTAKAYMVAHPVIALEAAGRNGGETWGTFACVPHSAGSHSSPYNRWAIIRQSAGSSLEFRLSGSTSAVTVLTPDLNNGLSIGKLLVATNIDRILDGETSFGGPRAPGDTVTYPNATGLRLGGNGAGAENGNAEISAIVILSDNTSDETAVAGWHRDLSHRDLAVSDNLVLDIPFDGGSGTAATDESAYAHPVWFSGAATLAGGGLSPSTDGCALVQPSGLLIPNGAFMAECDIYLTALTANRPIFRMGAVTGVGATRGWYLSLHDTEADELMLVVKTGSSSFNYCTTNSLAANMTTGVWYTVRATIGADNWCRVYVDGVLKAERFIDGASAPGYTPRPLIIGNRRDRAAPFPGYIRNVKIWNGVATAP